MTPLTSEQESALRAATTTGDADAVHSAGVLAWRSIWATVDAARAQVNDLQRALEKPIQIVDGVVRPVPWDATECSERLERRLEDCEALLADVTSQRDAARGLVGSSASWDTQRLRAVIAEENLAKMAAERDEARRWAEDVVARVVATRVVTCHACGLQFEGLTADPMTPQLEAHIRVCEKHPLCAARIEIAASEARELVLVEALYPLVTACLTADAHEELGDVDGLLVHNAREALPQCAACRGHGSHDGEPHEDEVVPRCTSCEGWGFLSRRPNDMSALKGFGVMVALAFAKQRLIEAAESEAMQAVETVLEQGAK